MTSGRYMASLGVEVVKGVGEFGIHGEEAGRAHGLQVSFEVLSAVGCHVLRKAGVTFEKRTAVTFCYQVL